MAGKTVGPYLGMTDAQINVLEVAFRRFYTISMACSAAKVNVRTYHMWMSKGEQDYEAGVESPYTDFRQRILNALAEGQATAVEHILARGQEDWRAMAWLLERRHPESWARQQNTKVSVTQIPTTSIDEIRVVERMMADGIIDADALSRIDDTIRSRSLDEDKD